MVIAISVAAILLLIVFFLYAKTESLRREMIQLKRQLGSANGEVTALEKAVESLAFEQQVEFRKRLTRAKGFGHPDTDFIKNVETMIDGLINVIVDSAKGEKNTVEAFRKHLIKTSDISFADFSDFISKQDDRVKTEWHKKNVAGYLSIIQLLIDTLNGDLGE